MNRSRAWRSFALSGPGRGSDRDGHVRRSSRSVDVATQDVRDRVAAVSVTCPTDICRRSVSQARQRLGPGADLGGLGGALPRELTELADKTVKDRARARAVSARSAGRRPERAVNVWVDADRLAAYQHPDHGGARRDRPPERRSPGGNVTAGRARRRCAPSARSSTPPAFNDLVVATMDGAPVRVRDIG